MSAILVPVSKGPIPTSQVCLSDLPQNLQMRLTRRARLHIEKNLPKQAPKEKLARSKLTAGRRHRLSTEPTRTSLTKPGPNKPELSGASIEWRSQPLDKHGQNSGSTGAIRGALTQAQKVMVLLQVARILGGGLSLAFQLAQRSC